MLVENDLAQVYGIEVEDEWERRSWRWLSVRVVGLLSTESRLQRVLAPASPPTKPGTNG